MKLLSNCRAQGFGWIRLFFYSVFFLIIFALALAPFVTSSVGGVDLSDWGVFGAWVVGHMNVWFFGVFVLAVLVALVFGVVTSE